MRNFIVFINKLIRLHLGNKSRSLRWVEHVARIEEGSSTLNILTGKPIAKRPLGGPSRRWEENIRMDLKEIGINTRNWVDSAPHKYY